MRDLVIEMLKERGVAIQDVAQIVLDLQRPYNPALTMEQCLDSVFNVLDKREVQHCIVTGVTLDSYAEKGLLPEPLQTLMRQDNPLYGVDEILAVGITNVYGTIGLTNFGYLDKVKPGILAQLNNKESSMVHTFLDDIVAALAAAASARLAHNRRD
jgi:phosphatidylglycerophosphatase A